MNKRKFLKCSACLGASAIAGYALLSFSKNDEKTTERREFKIPHLGIPIVYHCNLNCARCCHFSTLVENEFMPISDFEKDIKRLKKITDGSVAHFALVGGEPLLHPDINKFIEILSKNFPDSRKQIMTNALFLNRMKDDFWEICRKYQVSLRCSIYKQSIQKEELLRISKEQSMLFRIIVMDEFNKMNLTQKNIYTDSWRECIEKIAHAQLERGKIFSCCVMSNIRFFNNYFKEYAIPLEEDDYIDIYKISSVDEILEHYSKPKKFCLHCQYAKESAPWEVSKKELSEWYNVNAVS